MEMHLRICALVVTLVIAGIAFPLHSPPRTTLGESQQEKSPSNGVRLDAFSFPIEIASSEVKHGTLLDIRFAYLYLDAPDFTERNLNELFTTFAAKYQDPQFLQIIAYSDREMLQRTINRSQDEGCGVWPEDQLPAKSGYFWAQYSRQDDAEYFIYTPDPERLDTMTAWLSNNSDRSEARPAQDASKIGYP